MLVRVRTNKSENRKPVVQLEKIPSTSSPTALLEVTLTLRILTKIEDEGVAYWRRLERACLR